MGTSKMEKLKLILLGVFVCAVMFVMPSCGKDDNEDPESEPENVVKPATFTVTFDTDGGNYMSAQKVEKNGTVKKPEDPEKPGFFFKEWLCDGSVYDFTQPVTADLTLKAVWNPKPTLDDIYTALNGEFSVAFDKKVRFSSGNLQYCPSSMTYRFAEKQYDVVGKDNENISESYDGWLDLFGWGTGRKPTARSTMDMDREFKEYKYFYDWGENIGNGITWFTLSNSEWEYLISKRVSAAEKYGVGKVANVNGFILLPDDWTQPDGLTFNSGCYDIAEDEYFTIQEATNHDYYYMKMNVFSAEEWEKMEAAGAVFLPAASLRRGISFYADYLDMEGDYWTSSKMPGADCAYCLDFVVYRVMEERRSVDWGVSVRLVRVVQ